MRLRSKGLSSRRVEDEIVVLDLEQSKYLTFGGGSVVLFELLQNGCERADLVEALLAAYEVDEDRAAADVDEFVESLAASGLLVDESS